MRRIALVGNPNTGKSTLFNQLTGLKQKIGNYPGVTVDKKSGICKLDNGETVEIIDLPGTYSLNASSKDEEIVAEALTNPAFDQLPELVVVVADATNLKRNLLLFTQIIDLKLPVILALNMYDMVSRKGLELDINGLSEAFQVPVVSVVARKGKGIETLKKAIEKTPIITETVIFDPRTQFNTFIEEAKKIIPEGNSYRVWLKAGSTQYHHLSPAEQQKIVELQKDYGIIPQRVKVQETVRRYAFIDVILKKYLTYKKTAARDTSEALDKIFTHRLWGMLIFFGLLTIVFQAVFSWSSVPMDLIENFFTHVSNWVNDFLPPGPMAGLIADGLVPGLAGVLVFIPQIAILFAFIALLEETGYMSRVVFLMDKIMRSFGMNGRSVVPMMSGLACAIPAVMATRGIDNWKERMITIMVTPLMTCSARLPVYTILISLVIPTKRIFGFINLQGLVLMGMYLFGFLMALLAAIVFKKLLKSSGKGMLIMEMPPYKWPQGNNVGFTIIEKVKSFVFEAGKIIIAISIVLWVLASFGPSERKEMAAQKIEQQADAEGWDKETTEKYLSAAELENSYMGIFGKSIEPAIKPLGYDWKIGIALLSSFAAREVFVGTMATIYAVGEPDNEMSIKGQMAADVDLKTGQPRFTLAVAFSLLIFYALAMQCMSTLAVVYRETKGWKWPIIQFVFMTSLAYLFSLIIYQLLK